MNRKNLFLLLSELLWLIIIAVLIYFLVYPFRSIADSRFLFVNAAMIFLLVQYARHIVALYITFIGKFYYLQIVLFFAQFILFFLVLREFRNYLGPLKDESLFEFSDRISYGTYNFIFREWIFFATGALVLNPILIFRLYLSILKKRQSKF